MTQNGLADETYGHATAGGHTVAPRPLFADAALAWTIEHSLETAISLHAPTSSIYSYLA